MECAQQQISDKVQSDRAIHKIMRHRSTFEIHMRTHACLSTYTSTQTGGERVVYRVQPSCKDTEKSDSHKVTQRLHPNWASRTSAHWPQRQGRTHPECLTAHAHGATEQHLWCHNSRQKTPDMTRHTQVCTVSVKVPLHTHPPNRE